MYLPSCRDALQGICLEELDTEHKLNRALIKILGFRKQDKISLDLLLLWDLPNYLDGKVLRAIIEYLLPHCSDDAILHIYIHTRERMPVKPGTYTIGSSNKVCVKRNSSEKTQSPMYYKESLQKALSPFLVQRGVLLSNGVQEYLLKRS